MNKSTVDEIRCRFDGEVDRFSNLDTGQAATIDAPLVLDLITSTAAAVNPTARRVLDIGCGAGNYTLKLLQQLPNLDCTLIDLSSPMLDRARSRVSQQTTGVVKTLTGDIRDLDLGAEPFDIVVAAAVLHHLRDDVEWQHVFAKVYASLRPGGSFWISDLIGHTTAAVQQEAQSRYGRYLSSLKDDAYRDQVFAYIEKEDSPRPLMFQLDLLRSVGFGDVDVLHKNSVFAAFGAIKPLAA